MDINFLGHIDAIRYLDNSVIIIASERRAGFMKGDGTKVEDELLTYKFVFKSYFKSYVAKYFSNKMLVKIKGFMLPYARDKDGNFGEGYTIIGQTIDRATYQTNTYKAEKKMIKESQEQGIGTPNLDDFVQPDF